jgi:hypothetical protein
MVLERDAKIQENVLLYFIKKLQLKFSENDLSLFFIHDEHSQIDKYSRCPRYSNELFI